MQHKVLNISNILKINFNALIYSANKSKNDEVDFMTKKNLKNGFLEDVSKSEYRAESMFSRGLIGRFLNQLKARTLSLYPVYHSVFGQIVHAAKMLFRTFVVAQL